MTTFNRKDPQVETDARTLTLMQFVEKYQDTANKMVLLSVYKNFKRTSGSEKAVFENSDHSTKFVEPEKEEIEEEVESPKVLKVSKPKAEAKVTEEKDKPGRTPAMRELMKIHGKEDKAKIKRLLTEDGFNCEGSGFHSEWNRLKTK